MTPLFAVAPFSKVLDAPVEALLDACGLAIVWVDFDGLSANAGKESAKAAASRTMFCTMTMYFHVT